ncbi:GD11929 [Drosophila simulans]|uniref:GD11929 n=1 Tax=Drosophila simulans TaxID=7240 RepID=B4NVD7_DROSI|nr:GD11929 [Drosophila simulans]
MSGSKAAHRGDMAAQLISGHGCFRSYLKRFGHEDADDCPWCGGGRSETAEHVLFSCVKYARERSSLETVLGGRLNADNLVPFMLQGEAEWQAVTAAITTELRRAERARRVHETKGSIIYVDTYLPEPPIGRSSGQ